jgi:hypothetical protein
MTLQKYLRRVADRTMPNMSVTGSGRRREDRYNRAIPTLVAPWEEDQVDRSRCAIVLTRDIADRGVGLITQHPLPRGDVILGYWISFDDAHEPWFFRGTIQREDAIGGGFWAIGVEMAEFMNENWRSALEPLVFLAHKLVPPMRVCSHDAPGESWV